jgi:CBS domain-containing protein
MQINEIMSKGVQTIHEQASALAAWDRMQNRKIHHLVVTAKGGRVVGVISERNLGTAAGPRFREGRTVAELMTPQVLKIQHTATVRAAANKMRGRGIGCLPVFKQEKLVGILTVTDLLDLIGRGQVIAAPPSKK